MSKPIFIAVSPNFEKDDLKLMEKLCKNQIEYKGSSKALEDKLYEYFGVPAVCFDSARSSLYAILKVLNLSKEDEVLILSFSCMVVANACIWAGAKPIYVDCNKENFGFDLEDLKKKVSKNTKAVIIQNTFGLVEPLDKIKEIVGKDVLIIEDLGHCMGAEFQGKKLGAIGDCAIITFGTEKVIASGRGGACLIKDKELLEKIRGFQSIAKEFPKDKEEKFLKNPLIWEKIIPLYFVGVSKYSIGKLIAFLGYKFKQLGEVIEDSEFMVEKPEWLPSKISEKLAKVVLNQFDKIEKFNDHRIKIAKIYDKILGFNLVKKDGNKSIFLRYPILTSSKEKKDEVIAYLRKEKIIIGTWYSSVLLAPEEAYTKLQYTKGSCSNTEYVSERIINLPTHIRMNEKEAEKIAKLVKECL